MEIYHQVIKFLDNMKFKISQELDTNAYKKSHVIESISSKLELFLKTKNYGNDIETFFIGFIGMKTKQGLEGMFKERKPKYISYKQVKNRLTGELIEVLKEYSYDIKFNNELYDEFVNGTDELSEKLFVQKLLESLKHFDKLPKEVHNFDVEKFKEDIHSLFME